jgi:O-antigen ligase
MYPKNIQNLLGWLFFFLTWPVLNIGVNITFFIFVYTIYKIGQVGIYRDIVKINDFVDKTIFVFIIWALFCSITQPYLERNPSFFVDFKYNIQHVYWLILFLFLKNNYSKIDLYLIGKFSFFGSIFLVVSYNFFPGKVDFFGLVSLTTRMGRNSFVYQVECFVPIVLIFLRDKSIRTNLIILLSYFLITLITNGRAGTIIVFLYLIGYLMINNIVSFKGSILVGVLVGLFYSLGFLNTKFFMVSVANNIRPLNERIANLILTEEDGDLDFDKSWIERQIHIAKAVEVFENYPIKGVGLNHFLYFDSDYSYLDLDDYLVNGSVRVTERNLEDFSKRSAHNSYMQILAETGLIGLFIYLIFLFPMVIFSLQYLLNNKLVLFDVFLLAAICIAIHNWVISAYSGAISFAIFGLAYGRMMQLKQNALIK